MKYKTITLGKIASELKVGIQVLVLYLEKRGFHIEVNPAKKLIPEQYRILHCAFGKEKTYLLKEVSSELGVTMTQIVDFLQMEGVPITKPYSPDDRILKDEYDLVKYAFDDILKFKRQSLAKYFDLNIENDKIYSSGPVENGVHGVEIINGEYYASLYHIKNFIAKGELKSFLDRFTGSSGLIEFARILNDQYRFDMVYVKYANQSFAIKKYPYSAILNYFNEVRQKDDAELDEQIESESAIGLCELKARNFRRFKSLEPISLGKINFFVGQNNAGKSTVVEILRYLVSYLKQTDHSTIDLKGVQFKRILTKGGTDNEPMPINLGGTFDDCSFEFSFVGLSNKTEAIIQALSIDNTYFTADIDFRYSEIQVTLKIKDDDFSLEEMNSLASVAAIQQEIDEIERKLSTSSLAMKQKLELSDAKNKLEKDLKTAKNLVSKSVNKKLPKDESLFFEISKERINQYHGESSIQNILREMYDVNEELYSIESKRTGLAALRQEVRERRHTFEKYMQSLFNRISLTEVHYLEGTSMKLGSILKSGEKQDHLLETIRYLKEEQVFDSKNHLTLMFIKKWLGFEEGFGIAHDIRVFDFESEVFTVELLSKNNHWHFIGDYGLGAQRLFELVIGIAKIIHHYGKVKKAFKPLILVEEPEAHIHPALQAQLADFFYSVNLEYNLRPVIETHSEYIIRRTQALGIRYGLFTQQFSQNPFNVSYFDLIEGPYSMKYLNEGSFDRDFGSGFYNVVDDISMEIFLDKQSHLK